jgi:FkbM family methyltransferase
MLIDFETIKKILNENEIHVTGVLHIGAHDCEESNFYNKLGLNNDDIFWIEAMENKVKQAKNKGINNIYNHVITDTDDHDVVFNVSNNIQSSSVLEFGTHLAEHPWVQFTHKLNMKSITVDTFVKRHNIDIEKLNFWNLDIQGAELLALKGAQNSLKDVKVLYLEVNEKELYVNCGLIGELDTFLSNFNFKRVFTEMTHHGWGDAIYIKGA